MPKKKVYTIKVDGRTLELSNLDKVFWRAGDGIKSGEGRGKAITKGDVIEYYSKIAPYILPYLKDRPQSMNRYPNGIRGVAFYQKDTDHQGPEWLTKARVRSESAGKGASRTLNYLVCNDKATLLYMANLGCIEINPWLSRTKAQDRPDFMVIDLDPGKGADFKTVIKVAQGVKKILDELGVAAYPKTSGATGLHIYVPMGAKYDYEQVKEFGHLVSVMAHQRMPKITTLERLTRKRPRATVLLDYLQNRKGQTLATVYSLRPKPGAPVSTPLKWSEVRAGLEPTDFNIKNVFKRLDKVGDLWCPVMGKGMDLGKVLRKIK